MSDTVKLVTDLPVFSGTIAGESDQVLVVLGNKDTVRVPFDLFRNSQLANVPASPTDAGQDGNVSVTEDAVYTYANGEWGKSPRSLDWGVNYLYLQESHDADGLPVYTLPDNTREQLLAALSIPKATTTDAGVVYIVNTPEPNAQYHEATAATPGFVKACIAEAVGNSTANGLTNSYDPEETTKAITGKGVSEALEVPATTTTYGTIKLGADKVTGKVIRPLGATDAGTAAVDVTLLAHQDTMVDRYGPVPNNDLNATGFVLTSNYTGNVWRISVTRRGNWDLDADNAAHAVYLAVFKLVNGVKQFVAVSKNAQLSFSNTLYNVDAVWDFDPFVVERGDILHIVFSKTNTVKVYTDVTGTNCVITGCRAFGSIETAQQSSGVGFYTDTLLSNLTKTYALAYELYVTEDIGAGLDYHVTAPNTHITEKDRSILDKLESGGFDGLAHATSDTYGIVKLGTASTIPASYTVPVGLNEDGGLSVSSENMSAYEIAKKNGFVGTEKEWLDSLKGEPGPGGGSFNYDDLTDEEKAELVAPALDALDGEKYTSITVAPAVGDFSAVRLGSTVVPHNVELGSVSIKALNAMTTPLYLVAFVKTDQGAVVSTHISSRSLTWAVEDDVTWDFPEAIVIPDNNYVELYLCLELDDILFTYVVRPGNYKFKAAYNSAIVSNCAVRYENRWYDRVVPVTFYTKAHANDYSLHLTPTDRDSVDSLGSVIDSVEALNSALVSVDTPNGTETSLYEGHGFGFKTKYYGMLSSISFKCPEDGSTRPSTGAPSWIKVWGVDSNDNKTLLALSKNYQVHHVGDTLHYVFDPFYVSAGQELRVIFYSEDELDSTEYAVGTSSCCVKTIKLVATAATPIFGGMINNTGGYAYSGDTIWQADYEVRIVKAENNPEQPVTMLLRAVSSVSRNTTDLQGNSRTYVYKYAVEIPNISLDVLASVRLSADDCPIISPIVSLNNNTLRRVGYTVTLLRKNADIMADWWASLVRVSGIDASPDVTYLS